MGSRLKRLTIPVCTALRFAITGGRIAIALTGLCVAGLLAASPALASSSPIITDYAGDGTAGAPTPGPATSSELQYPAGVAVDVGGNVYIGDRDNSMVEKVTPDGTLSIVAGNGSYGAPTPGPATSSPLGDPSAVAVDGAGNVYIADRHPDPASPAARALLGGL
jgi:NHL repeat